MFTSTDSNADGFVESSDAVALFEQSGLERQALHEVWQIADVDEDGRLSLSEFVCAMHIIVCVSKRGAPLPSAMPRALAKLLFPQLAADDAAAEPAVPPAQPAIDPLGRSAAAQPPLSASKRDRPAPTTLPPPAPAPPPAANAADASRAPDDTSESAAGLPAWKQALIDKRKARRASQGGAPLDLAKHTQGPDETTEM